MRPKEEVFAQSDVLGFAGDVRFVRRKEARLVPDDRVRLLDVRPVRSRHIEFGCVVLSTSSGTELICTVLVLYDNRI